MASVFLDYSTRLSPSIRASPYIHSRTEISPRLFFNGKLIMIGTARRKRDFLYGAMPCGYCALHHQRFVWAVALFAENCILRNQVIATNGIFDNTKLGIRKWLLLHCSYLLLSDTAKPESRQSPDTTPAGYDRPNQPASIVPPSL